ncbi:hypothetical protein VaNZ11_013933 [Volvox africanus]|uniref:Multicopper ferroxidase n=1 Tax=Volvox africanus TaxID=51714 RepID=A0ABQ5SII5_9CHLO|nr:hypothetical protein VaNZ11_013933 [Volvox africanus]
MISAPAKEKQPEMSMTVDSEPNSVFGSGTDDVKPGQTDVESPADVASTGKATPFPAAAATADADGGKRRRVLWIALAAFVVVAVGVGVGVGVGIGLKKKESNIESVLSSVELGGVPGRTYFIAADQVSWNYAPSGRNLCYNEEVAAKFLPTGTTRVGGTFVKALYREYTDSSFKTLKPRTTEWEHLGSTGPLIRASVGDVVRIVFKNNLPADISVNMAPHGGVVAWEGAGRKSAGTAPVAPGATTTYLWLVPPEAGPAPNATVSSRLWLYRSSVDPTTHDNAGLVGPIIVTAADGAGPDGLPNDVDRELVVIFQVVNERSSNMLPYLDSHLTGGVSFTKMAMNGFVWCNLPQSAISLNVGQRVRWHVASVGSSDGLHNYHWHGHTVELNGHHVDQFTAIPGATYSVNMIPDEPGTWMFHCHVNYHMDGGMVNLYTVQGKAAPLLSTGVERTFYVAAEEVEWSYTGPNNTNMCGDVPVAFSDNVTGHQFVDGPWAKGTDSRLGYKLTKTLYREYTDATFTTLKERGPEDAYLGLVGPMLRVVVGDTLKVVLLNRAAINVSMHPHGVRYSKASEGTLYEDGTTAAQKLDDVVQPGQTYTYIWQATERSGPGPRDPSSMLWMYHSHLDETAETYAGLSGAIIVTDPVRAVNATTDPRPIDVDRELVVLFTVTNELESSNFMENLRSRLGDGGALAAHEDAVESLIADAGFQEHMLKHGINGFMYCNMPRLNFTQGQKVRMHVLVLGTLEDMHTPNMGGPRFDYNSQHTDSIQISPGGMISADVVMNSPGEYELQCRVSDHVTSGMRAKYEVFPDLRVVEATTPTSVVRKYYIQAEPVDWDYAPGGYQCNGVVDAGVQSGSNTYLLKTSYTMGSKYRKAVFRAYTDESFTVPASMPSYYGTMGPTLVVEVGDILEIHLRNNLTDLSYPVNIQLGGGLVPRGQNCKEVAVGQEACVYRWFVPSSAGPASDDFDTTVYGYTSTLDVAGAPNAGLAGALVVAAAGVLQPSKLQPGQLVPAGVDLMVPLYWQVMNEEQSPYWDINVAASGIDVAQIEKTSLSDRFHEGNLKHAINGYLYCNLPGLNIPYGSTVRWLLVAYGTEGDFHSPMFGGQVTKVDIRGFSTLASLMPSIARAADMRAVVKDTWLISCDVHDHYAAGMLAKFTVV